MSLPVFGFLKRHPRPAVERLRAELALGDRVAPVAERALGELHDVALVHERHRRLVVVDRVLERLAHQPVGALARDGLDADARGLREADLLDPHLLDQEVDHLARAVGLGRPLDAGVDVLRVLAEDHHVDLVRLLDRRGNAGEPAHRAQADVEVELLPQRHVERADAAADRRRERPLDRDHVVLQDFERLLGEPDVGAVDLGRLLAGVDLHPVDLALAAVGLGHRGVDDLDHHRRDVEARAVALDIGDDRLVGDVQAVILVDGDLFAAGRDLDVLVLGHGVS